MGVAIGAIVFVSGILAYQGKYKSWLVLKSFLFPGWPGLAGLYLGLGIMMASLSGFVVDAGTPGFLVFLWVVVMFASMVTGIIGMFWLPRFMWPPWIKDTADRIRRGESKLSQDMKPGGALHGKLGRPRTGRPTGPEATEPETTAAGARPGLSVSRHDSRSTGGGSDIDPQDEWKTLQ